MSDGPRAIIAAVLLCIAALRGAAADDPLAFSASAWDFGTVDRDAEPLMTLTVANRSMSVVTVTLIATCDCLAVDPARRAIAPEASASFLISFDPSGEEGEVSRTLVVATDVPGRPRSLFTVTGTVTGGGDERGDGGYTAVAGAPADGSRRVTLTYWYTPGCRSCERFLDDELPRLARELGIAIDVVRRDILVTEGYEEFAAAARARGATVRGIPGLLVGDGPLLQGEDEIRDGLASAIAATIDANGAASAIGVATPAPVEPSGQGAIALLPVLAGGLLDGINPCAFTTLIFLLASLALAAGAAGRCCCSVLRSPSRSSPPTSRSVSAFSRRSAPPSPSPSSRACCAGCSSPCSRCSPS